MRLSRSLSFNNRNLLVISVLLGICSVYVSSLPQWVWSPDAETGPKNSIGNGNIVFGGQIASDDKKDGKIKIDDTQGRLFLPGLLNAISGGGRPGNTPRPTTSRPSSSSASGGDGGSSVNYPPPTTDNNSGGGSSGSGGTGGGSGIGQGEGEDSGGSGGSCNTGACIGGSIASQAIEQGINAGTSVAENNNKYDPVRQTNNFRAPFGGVSGIFSNLIQSIFGGGASTLPAGIGSGSNNGGSSGGGGGVGGSTGSCTCEEVSRGCFLPARESGTCDGSRVRCCSSTRNTRTFFPDENGAYTSTNSIRTVTRSQIRRGLLKNIVRGSGSVIDDTLDLLLHPFLTREDQLKVATRVISDD